MWDGLNTSVNNTSFRNYMYGNNVYLMDTITSENCAYLIGDLSTFIQNEQNRDIGEINFYINSSGGEVYTALAIIGLMNLARAYDFKVSTWVFGWAASAASLIATQGDYRVISKYSRHFLHFGTITDITCKYSEIEKTCQQNLEYANSLHELYISASHGRLNSKLLHELESDERGYVLANKCVEYGLADVILENDLAAKQNYELAKALFDKEYQKSLKPTNTRRKEVKKDNEKIQ